MPNLTEKLSPSKHSSMEVKRGKFGEEDPLGINEAVWEEVKQQMEELNNVEEFKPRHLTGLRKQWFEKCQDIINGASPRLSPL